MSITDGKKVVSLRKRMLAYCEQHHVKVPSEFHTEDPVYKIAVIDITIPERPLLLSKTFYNARGVLEYLKDNNKHPQNYKALDFEKGVELYCEGPLTLKTGQTFDNRKDVDVVY